MNRDFEGSWNIIELLETFTAYFLTNYLLPGAAEYPSDPTEAITLRL